MIFPFQGYKYVMIYDIIFMFSFLLIFALFLIYHLFTKKCIGMNCELYTLLCDKIHYLVFKAILFM